MNKDDATWLNYCYIAFAGISAYVLLKAFETVGIQSGWSDRYDEFYPVVSRFLAVILGACSAVWLRASRERGEYYLASIGEIRKVAWPSIPDTKRMTVVVVIVVAIFSVILTVFDLAWSRILQSILP